MYPRGTDGDCAGLCVTSAASGYGEGREEADADQLGCRLRHLHRSCGDLDANVHGGRHGLTPWVRRRGSSGHGLGLSRRAGEPATERSTPTTVGVEAQKAAAFDVCTTFVKRASSRPARLVSQLLRGRRRGRRLRVRVWPVLGDAHRRQREQLWGEIRTPFVCQVEDVGDGDWRLIDLTPVE